MWDLLHQSTGDPQNTHKLLRTDRVKCSIIVMIRHEKCTLKQLLILEVDVLLFQNWFSVVYE